MKKIIIFLATLSICGTTNAGLFEYYMGVDTIPNSPSNADTVEIIEEYEAPKIQKTYSRFSYENSYKDNYSYYTTQKYPNRSYYEDIRAQNGYYSYDEVKRRLEYELKRYEREAEDIDDLKRDIKLKISRMKKYHNGRYYYDKKRALEDTLDDIENRERYVEDMIDDIEDDIKDLKRNKKKKYSYKNEYYYDYHHNGTYFDTWYENLPYRLYYNSDSYYNNTRYKRYRDEGYYYYDTNFGWTYKPSWVNSNLDNIRSRDIYIK